MLTQEEMSLSDARPNLVDHDAVPNLHYLGNYKRKLPTNMARMIENAYDWEHLPYVHASSFASIDLIDSGDWGWRAKIGLHGGRYQLLDLRLDTARNYWVSTVYVGPGAGLEIHTQASSLPDQEIEVDVRFYVPEPLPDASSEKDLHAVLAGQYRQLYDEDIGLMSGRQSALEDRSRWRAGEVEPDMILVGAVSDLDRTDATVVETKTGRFCVRYWNETWVAYSAVCPHLLGPLGESAIAADGTVTCPWHGYRFDVTTGENIGGHCNALTAAPSVVVQDGHIYLRFA